MVFARSSARRGRRNGGRALTGTAAPLAATLAAWVSTVRFEDLPADVVASTKARVLDVVGLALAGGGTAFGRGVIAAAAAMSPPGPAHVFGTGARLGAGAAAFANAACAQALEFDDTHNESIVHMSSPAVAAVLALAETRCVTGREALTAIAAANEIACRIGVVAPGQFHRRGFHPTGLFAPFGVTYLAGRLLGLDEGALTSAAGRCGSFAAGVLECWVDGTEAKFLHSGWAAQSGIAAAILAGQGVTGPATILEGRFGLFASHLPEGASRNFVRVTDGLGTHWESRNASMKPYPAAHVLHPYVDAVLRAREIHHLDPADIVRIDCPVAEFNVSIVCEPIDEKVDPASDAHARISLQHTIAEALVTGTLGRRAYAPVHLADPQIRALARRVHYRVDPSFPGPGRFRGEVRVTLRDGRVIDEVQEYNRGSAENPMSAAELRAKFDDNVAGVLQAGDAGRLADSIAAMDRSSDVGELPAMTVRSAGREHVGT